MPVELWIGQEFETSHERKALDHFLTDMQTRFGQSDDLHLILANYYLDGRQIDLTVLKGEAAIVVELKESPEPFQANENGPWLTIPDGAVIGTGDQNPFKQAKAHRFRLVNKLIERQSDFLPEAKAQSMDFYHVSAFVAITPSLHPDHENQLPGLPWFRLVGLDQLSEAVRQQTSRKLNFSDQELRALAADILHLKPVDITSGSATSARPLPGHIGRYQLLDLLGQGGMGTVYRAYDPELAREVVVKLITSASFQAGPEWRERFKREVQAASQFNHPQIITIYDVSLEHDPPYVVMELLTGGTLEERLKQESVSWSEALHLLRLLAQALGYAHQAGVIHRDVKPANIMFAGNEINSLKLVDFGLARWQGSEALTQAGIAMGTPAYMSPEQARGDSVDHRTDIFALGIILFEATAGYNPLDKGSSISSLLEVAAYTAIDTAPLVNKVPAEVIALIKKATAQDRQQRYQNCEALLADLERCLAHLSEVSAVRSTPFSTMSKSSAGPDIRKARGIHLTPEIELILRTMFDLFSQVAVEAEFDRGFSGSRVFRIRLIETDGKAHLPAIVKIAPAGLIREEWEAYQTQVAYTLPNIAHLQGPPTFLADSQWAGLCYSLVGGGTFASQSLHDYYQQATIEDVCWVLENRLFQIMGPNWWQDNRTNRAFQMQTDYDSLLPVNLLLKPFDSISEPEVSLIELAGRPPVTSIAKGDRVRLNGFVITKVDPQRRQLTLNLPPGPADQMPASYRLRLHDMPDITSYRAGDTADEIHAAVIATRHSLLSELASQALGPKVDLSKEQLTTPNGLSLPNPLLTYQDLLQDFLTVKISTLHGDLNLENILVDPATREVSLIDFATVRQGHALRDLLRLETEVVIMLIPPILAETGLPAETIYPFYEQLHQATLQPGQFISVGQPYSALEKPFKMLQAIRKMARRCLFNIDDWREYYRGLIPYLLGALKINRLQRLPTAPLPSQAAFWGAATAQYLLKTNPLPPQPLSRSSSIAYIKQLEEPISEIESPYGTMPPNAKLYIERAADAHCREVISKTQAATLFIQAPRQMGKSSLMQRIIAQAATKLNRPTAFIDFQQFPTDYFDHEESFLIEFCLMLSEALSIPENIDAYWQGRRTNIVKCSRYVADYIIPQVNLPFILALDEVERMLTSPFKTNFFGMLRTWHNERARNHNLAQMTLLLSSSTEPYLFIENANQSPFNVAEIITLQDFSRAEVEELNRRHGTLLRQNQIDDLMTLLNGHPFLVRLAFYQLTTGKFDFEALLAQATAEAGPFGDHLNYYLLRVLNRPELKEALREICRRHTYEENQVFYRLKGAGLIKKVGQQIVLRNRLYAHYFEERLND